MRFKIMGTCVTGAVACAMLLSACGGGATESKAGGPIKISFWNSASGATAEAVDKAVKEFNKENKGKIEVDSIYQGGYGDAISKLANSVQANNLPDVMQVNDANTVYMRDAGVTIPVQDINDAAKEKTDLNNLLPVVRQYYTLNGKLIAMPFMASSPMLFINPDLAKKANLDVNKPPQTRAELIEWAKQIHQKTGKPGLVFHIGSWWFEEWTASNGLEYCTPDNGVGKDPAKTFQLANSKQVDVWKDFQQMYKNGDALNVGTDSKNAQAAFDNQEAGMIILSSSGLGNLEKNAKFTPVAAKFPIDDPGKGGIVIGGNALWVFGHDAKDPKVQAAWKFVTYMTSEKAQKTIFEKSGNLPGNRLAIDTLEKNANPARKVILQQIEGVKASNVTAGCHSGAIQQVREKLGDAMNKILKDGADPAQVLSKLEKESTTAVDQYIKRAGKH